MDTYSSLSDLYDRANEIHSQKLYELIDTLINEDNTPLDLTEMLNEPYKTMYKKAKTFQSDFLTGIHFWERVNLYEYEKGNEKFLFFEIWFKMSEEGKVDIFTSACCEYQGACYGLCNI